MKELFKRILAVMLIVSVLVPAGITASAADTMVTSSFSDTLDKKSEELAKNLAEKGIKKAIGSIPVVGGTLNSIAGPYIKKLLGIKEGESTATKLDRIDKKLDTLMKTVSDNSKNEMQKIYEQKFGNFNDLLLKINTKTHEYLSNIHGYEEDENISDLEKTLLIAELTEMDKSEFSEYCSNIMLLSQYVTGDSFDLYKDADIFTRAYRVYCFYLLKEDDCALGGEAAIQASDYVKAISEVVESAHATADMMLIARCCVGDRVSEFEGVQDDISLKPFTEKDSNFYKNKFILLKEQYYKIFGITEEEAKEETDLKSFTKAEPGAVGEYNRMIEDRWFDYIDDVDFDSYVPSVKFVEIDGEIGFASLQDFGFSSKRALSLSEDSSISFCKSISKKALSAKHASLDDTRLNKLMKHIETSDYFKTDPDNDFSKDSLKDALTHYGFSFAGLDSSEYGAEKYAKIFVTDAKCTEDYRSYSDGEYSAYIRGYVYGIDYGTDTQKMNDKSSAKSYQYFKGDYTNRGADERNVDFPGFTMLYFTHTVEINSADDFKKFISDIAGGNNYASTTVMLNCDLDLGGTDLRLLWPDSARKKEFCGTFDGCGHTIRNFHIPSEEDRTALFRTTGDNAVIKNLIFTDVDLECTAEKSGCAAVVGYANGSLTLDCITVESGSITGYKYVGGLVGETKEGKYSLTTITGCQNYATVTANDTDAGGLAANAAALLLDNCYNGGSVTAQKGAAGGLVGYIGNKDEDPSVYAGNSFNDGTIVGYDCAGGIIGHIESDSSGVVVEQNTNTGDVTVTGKRSAGGIIGRTCAGGLVANNKSSGTIVNLSTASSAEAGGILGENEDDAITVSGNENTGSVTANQRAGGITGTLGDRDHDKACTITDNTNSGSVTSNAKDAGGIVGAVATDNTSHSIAGNANTGNIKAQSEAGGIVGWMAGGGLFDTNESFANITSVDRNAGGIVGCIQDDKCDFRKSSLGNTYPGVGTLSDGQLAGSDYYINALNTEQHAGIICGWDGKRKAIVNNDSLIASIFGDGRVAIISALAVVLAAAIVVFIVVYNKKKKAAK